jgi:protein HIRA/HIR1
LVGHDNDVQDLAWSYDSSILVSVGLDSKVVVWSGHNFEKLKTLSQHQSHVKGITFDPANKYFATASDDRTIKVYRFTSPLPNATAHDSVGNFTLETTISEPFMTSPLTTYFRRCSWSPDGMHIAAANAVNGPVPSVAIVSRGSWDSSINFIGHEAPVEVCAFCPRMFYKEKPTPENMDPNGNPQQSPVSVIACGSQDKALSIWNTRLTRPFVITQALATKAISDLAWAPDGAHLFVTTLDGAILTVIFEEGELGFVAPQQENERALSRYGAGRKAGIVEGAESLVLEELSKKDELKGVQGRMGELMGDSAMAVTVAPPPATNGDHALTNGTTTNGTTNGTSTPDLQQAKITQLKQRVEIVGGKKRVKPLLISSTPGTLSSLPQTQLVANTTHSKGSNDNPHSLLDLSKPYDGFPKGGLVGLLLGNKRKFAEIAGDDEHRTEKRIHSLTKDGAAAIVMNTQEGLALPKPSDISEPLIPSSIVPHVVDPALVVSNVRLATPLLRSTIIRTVDASAPPKDVYDAPNDLILLEARNATGPPRTGHQSDRDPTRINCIKAGQAVWQDFLPKPVLLVTGNPQFWAAACDDGALYVWTPAGRRLLNAIVLESQPVIMDCRGWWLMVITAVGMVRVWNLQQLKAPHPPVSVAPVLDIAIRAGGPQLLGTPGIVFARLNSEGRIIVAITNGDGYTYNPDLAVWQRLAEPWFAVGSQYWNTTDSSTTVANVQQSGTSKGDDKDFIAPENLSAGIIPLLERNTTQQVQLRGRAYMLQRLHKALLVAEGFEGFEASVSVAHLENRIAAAMALGARDEFRVYLLMYAKRIGSEGLKLKVEELLRMLLGDIFEGENKDAKSEITGGRTWFTTGYEICGWSRLELLKEVVLILGMFLRFLHHHTTDNTIGKNRDIQRLTVPYARILGLVREAAETNGDEIMQDASVTSATASLGFVAGAST